MTLFKRLSVTTLFLVVAAISTAASVGAVSSGGIGGRPAHPDPNNPRTQSIFILTADKGETKKDVILVSNNSDQLQTIKLYAVDGIVTNTGAYTCAQESETKQGVGSWVTLDKAEVTLAAGKTEEVGFSLTMPTMADVGEHNGCIVFQLATDEGEATGNVRIRTRQAIRVVATVPGELHRSVEIQGFVVSYNGSKQVYTLDLKNSGNVSADVDAKVYLTSLFGGVAYENGGGYPVLADQKLNLTFVNESRPMLGGWYYVQAKASYDNRAGTFGTAENKYLTTKTTDRKMVFIAPTVAGMLVIVAILVLVGGVIAWYVMRRQSRVAAYKHGHTYVVVAGDSITSVADAYKIDWKRLASINQITAPYVLHEGQTLHVPKNNKKSTVSKKQSNR